jgi:hypothetical protein
VEDLRDTWKGGREGGGEGEEEGRVLRLEGETERVRKKIQEEEKF